VPVYLYTLLWEPQSLAHCVQIFYNVKGYTKGSLSVPKKIKNVGAPFNSINAIMVVVEMGCWISKKNVNRPHIAFLDKNSKNQKRKDT